MKTDKDKKIFLDQLRRTPIIQVVCEKTGIARSTYYRWRNKNKSFRKSSDEAILEGTLLINDMAESQLINLIRDKHPTGIIYWLKNHHPNYSEKLHLIREEKYEELKPKQIRLLAKAMEIVYEEYIKTGIPRETDGSNIDKERNSRDWDHF